MFRLKRHRSTVTCAAAERVVLQRSGGGYFRREKLSSGLHGLHEKQKTHTSAWNVTGVSPGTSWENMSGGNVEKRLGASLAATALRLGRGAAFAERHVWEFLLD